MKGAVIASDATPDKNKLSTGTLTYSDIQNKADYKAESSGYSVGTQKGSSGYSPGIPVSGNAGSTTQSAIAPGTIVVGGKAVTPESLRRDTTTALNELGKIFDKKTVQEKQELANLFSQVAYNELGTLAINKGWVEGGTEKTTLYAVVGGIISIISNGSFSDGALSAGTAELLAGELAKIKSPELRQFVGVVIGGAISKISSGNAQTGGSIVASEIKNNLDGEHEVIINGEAFLASGLSVILINGQKSLVDDTGRAIAWFSDKGTWIVDETSNAWDDFVIWAKGKEFRGGSISDRDKWYGYNDKEFQRWWHRKGKAESGGNDIDNAEEAQNAYDDWVSQGKPKVK